MLSRVSDLFDGRLECFGVGLGGLRCARDFAHVLQRRGMDFVRGGVGFEIMALLMDPWVIYGLGGRVCDRRG